jgi:DNA excision repair protein ERCC-4
MLRDAEEPASAGPEAKTTRVKVPKAEIAPEDLTAVVDTRERRPLDLSPLRACYGTLPTGDYSVLGLEHVVAIERKSLPDLVGCVGRHRRRFDREVQRLLAFPVRALVVEASWSELEAGNWEGRVKPIAAVGSALGWVASGLPVLMAGNRRQAARFVSRPLWIAAQRRWRENRALLGGLRPLETPGGGRSVDANDAVVKEPPPPASDSNGSGSQDRRNAD